MGDCRTSLFSREAWSTLKTNTWKRPKWLPEKSHQASPRVRNVLLGTQNRKKGRKEGRKEDCQHDMQKLNVHMCFLYNGPKKHGDQEFLTCTKCQKTFHAENRRELVNCPWDPQGKQYADKQKSDARKEVEECEMRNSTLDGQIQLQDGQNSRARLNFDGHSSFHPWLKVYQNNFVGSDTEFHINKVNYQGNQVFLELDEPCFGGLKHSRVEFSTNGSRQSFRTTPD